MIKVIHLLNHLEKIERDLTEIDELKSRLEQDRTYTSRVRESLEEETLRLRNLQKTIGRLVVTNPPEEIQLDMRSFLSTLPERPRSRHFPEESKAESPRKAARIDIIIPEKKSKERSVPKQADAAKAALEKNEKNGRKAEAGKKTSGSQKASPSKLTKAAATLANNPPPSGSGDPIEPPFRWKFIQN